MTEFAAGTMFKLIVGLMMGIVATLAGIGAIWIAGGFGIMAVILHIKSSRTMNEALATCEQLVTPEAKSGEIRQALTAPMFAMAMGFLAKACAVAAVWGVLVAVGIVWLP